MRLVTLWRVVFAMAASEELGHADGNRVEGGREHPRSLLYPCLLFLRAAGAWRRV